MFIAFVNTGNRKDNLCRKLSKLFTIFGKFLIRFWTCEANGTYMETNGRNKRRRRAKVPSVREIPRLNFNFDSNICERFLMNNERIIERKAIKRISIV